MADIKYLAPGVEILPPPEDDLWLFRGIAGALVAAHLALPEWFPIGEENGVSSVGTKGWWSWQWTEAEAFEAAEKFYENILGAVLEWQIWRDGAGTFRFELRPFWMKPGALAACLALHRQMVAQHATIRGLAVTPAPNS